MLPLPLLPMSIQQYLKTRNKIMAGTTTARPTAPRKTRTPDIKAVPSEDAAPIVSEEPLPDDVFDPWAEPEEQIDPPEATTLDVFVPSMRILVLSSRNWDNQDKVVSNLTTFGLVYGEKARDALLIHGGGVNADRMAAQQWTIWGGHCHVEMPRWNAFGNVAAIKRDSDMVNMLQEGDCVIAFIKNADRNTIAACDQAAKNGLRVIRVTD